MHEHLDTTLTRAKASQRFSERLITLARRGDLHARRIAFSRIRDKAAVTKLFDELGPRFKDRNGGYTRVLKLGPRRGDGAEMASNASRFKRERRFACVQEEVLIVVLRAGE